MGVLCAQSFVNYMEALRGFGGTICILFFYLSWIIKLQIQVTVTRKTVKTFVNDERLIWLARGHAIDKMKERTFLPGKMMRTRIFKN